MWNIFYAKIKLTYTNHFRIGVKMASYNLEDMNFNTPITFHKTLGNGIGTFMVGWILGWIIGGFYALQAGLLYLWVSGMEKLGRRRIIMDRENNEPYLERYYLFLKDRNEWFPFNIFIHKFLRGDPDNLHDHPWGFFTFILKGGYWEHMFTDAEKKETKRIWRGPGFYQKVKSEHSHRIELAEGVEPCWTLFIPFKKERTWGFWKYCLISDLVKSEDNPDTLIEWVESEKYFGEKLRNKNKKEAKKNK